MQDNHLSAEAQPRTPLGNLLARPPTAGRWEESLLRPLKNRIPTLGPSGLANAPQFLLARPVSFFLKLHLTTNGLRLQRRR